MLILSGTHPLIAAAREWLAALQRCVRAVDYAGARPLFAPEVQGFGTHAAIARRPLAVIVYTVRGRLPTISDDARASPCATSFFGSS